MSAPTKEYDFKIEKGIPYEKKQKANHFRWPFEAMEIGDSFFAPISVVAVEDVRVRCSQASKDGKKFVCKKLTASIGLEHLGGCRVWRLT